MNRFMFLRKHPLGFVLTNAAIIVTTAFQIVALDYQTVNRNKEEQR